MSAILDRLAAESPDPILLIDAQGVVRYANRSAGEIFGTSSASLAGSRFQHSLREDRPTQIEIVRNDQSSVVAEVSHLKFECADGTLYLVFLRESTARPQVEPGGEKIDRKSRNGADVLAHDDRLVLERQRSIIQEERLNLLLQVAGAAAHQINQPLMGLLGSIDLMRIHHHNPEKLARNLDRAEAAAKKIAGIVRKIQTIQRDETRPYLQDSVIIDLDQKLEVLFIAASRESDRGLSPIVEKHPQVRLNRALGTDRVPALLQERLYGMILMDAGLPDDFGFELLLRLYEGGVETPVVVVAGQGEEALASRLLTAGAYDYLPKSQLGEETFARVVTNVIEKFRLQRELETARRQISRQAITDDRTGLYNRQHFLKILESEMSRARRYDPDLVLGFCRPVKALDTGSDQLQARSGAVISMLGRLLSRGLRDCDIVCRYSTRTIAVIFPHTKIDPLASRLRHLRRSIDGYRFEYRGTPVDLTINIGIVAYVPAEIRSPQAFVDHARSALEKAAKRGGLFGAGVN